MLLSRESPESAFLGGTLLLVSVRIWKGCAIECKRMVSSGAPAEAGRIVTALSSSHGPDGCEPKATFLRYCFPEKAGGASGLGASPVAYEDCSACLPGNPSIVSGAADPPMDWSPGQQPAGDAWPWRSMIAVRALGRIFLFRDGSLPGRLLRTADPITLLTVYRLHRIGRGGCRTLCGCDAIITTEKRHKALTKLLRSAED